MPRRQRMITTGDGVRLATAVLLAGQMMTPDRFLVAESCPGNDPSERTEDEPEPLLRLCELT